MRGLPKLREIDVTITIKKANYRDYAAELLFILEHEGLPLPVREYTFAKPRRWRFDLAYPDWKLAIEIEGAVWGIGPGNWIRGRHTTGKGYENDLRKYNEAAIRGWCVLRFSPGMVISGEALKTICQTMIFSREVQEAAEIGIGVKPIERIGITKRRV